MAYENRWCRAEHFFLQATLHPLNNPAHCIVRAPHSPIAPASFAKAGFHTITFSSPSPSLKTISCHYSTMQKSMLLLVGLGIGDERGISCEGLDALRNCGKVFAESYTNILPQGTLRRLSKLIGKEIVLLGRQEVEGEKEILECASKEPTALIVPGDPLIATTHVSLVLAAVKKGIPCKVIHAASILSAAIGESGLQAYKFGKMVTLAYWHKGYRPTSAYDVICENKRRGLHTLLLLDIDEKRGPMQPSYAVKLLLRMEKKRKEGVLCHGTKLVLLQGVGRQRTTKLYRSIGQIASMRPCRLPAVLVVPGQLHFLEEEFLSLLEQQ